jgi:hypothetical protein
MRIPNTLKLAMAILALGLSACGGTQSDSEVPEQEGAPVQAMHYVNCITPTPVYYPGSCVYPDVLYNHALAECALYPSKHLASWSPSTQVYNGCPANKYDMVTWHCCD